jgi:hypothetical protein
MFLEASARNGEGVEEIFLKCARTILSKIEAGMVLVLVAQIHLHLQSPTLKQNATHLQIFCPSELITVLFGLLLLLLLFGLWLSIVAHIGTLDPSAIGSGVQHGDANANKPKRREQEESSGCPC